MHQRYDVLGFGLVILACALFAWTGFFGPVTEAGPKGVLFDYQTLIAGVLAVIAAILALRPAYQQLSELRTQSRQRELEALYERNIQLNEDRLALYATWSQAEVFRDELLKVVTSVNLTTHGFAEARARLDAATTQFQASIEKLHARRGHHWGSPDIFMARNTCIDSALRAGSIAFKANRVPNTEMLKRFELETTVGMQYAATIDAAANTEMARTADLIATLEAVR